MSETNQLPSHLFSVRVWQEKLSEEVIEVRFQVKHVLSGETRIFREEEQLLHYFLGKFEGGGEEDKSTPPNSITTWG